MEQPPRSQGRPRARVHGRVLRDHVREPRHRRSVGTEVPIDGSRRRAHRALSAGRRSVHRQDSYRRVGVLRVDRRHRRLVAVAAVGAVHAQREVRRQRSAVPQGHRLLRLPTPVPQVHRGVAVRRLGDRAHRHRGRALPQWWDPVPEPVPARHTTGESASLGDPRGDGSGEDRAVLPGSFRAQLLQSRRRRRRELHRRQGAAACAEHADRHLDHRRGIVHLEHPASRLGASDHCGRLVGFRVDRDRHDLPGGDPAVPGRAERVPDRGAVHQPQHSRDAQPPSVSSR